MKNEFLTQLTKTNTLKDFLTVCAAHYDFKNAKINDDDKASLSKQMPKILLMCNVKPKDKKTDLNEVIKDANKSENLAKYLEVFDKYYDFLNAKIGLIVKNSLISNIPNLIKAVNAKPINA